MGKGYAIGTTHIHLTESYEYLFILALFLNNQLVLNSYFCKKKIIIKIVDSWYRLDTVNSKCFVGKGFELSGNSNYNMKLISKRLRFK